MNKIKMNVSNPRTTTTPPSKTIEPKDGWHKVRTHFMDFDEADAAQIRRGSGAALKTVAASRELKLTVKEVQALLSFKGAEMVCRFSCRCPSNDCPSCCYAQECPPDSRMVTADLLFRLHCLDISINDLLDTGKVPEFSMVHIRCFAACLADNPNLCQADAEAAKEAIRQAAPTIMQTFCERGGYDISDVAQFYADVVYEPYSKPTGKSKSQERASKRSGRLRNELIALASGKEIISLDSISAEAFYALRVLFGMDLDQLLDGNRPHRDLKSRIISCL